MCINIPCDGKMGEDKVDTSFLIKEIFYEVGFKYRNKIYWDKEHLHNYNAKGSFGSASCPNILLPFEEIIVLYKENKKKEKTCEDISELIDTEFTQYTNGHWKIPGCKKIKNNKECPAPFPEEIPARLIKLFSYRNNIILDPFLWKWNYMFGC